LAIFEALEEEYEEKWREYGQLIMGTIFFNPEA
jgi:hypothetical protein